MSYVNLNCVAEALRGTGPTLWPVVHGETTVVTSFQELLKYSSTSRALVIGLPWLLIQKYRFVGVAAIVSVVT